MIRLLTAIGFALVFSPQALAAACPASGDSTSAGNGTCTVTGSASTIQLNFISGFDTATAIAAIDGNNGTTVGAQRKLSFIKAAEIIAEQVSSAEPILIDANFSALSCDAFSATLGSAGASSNLGNVSRNKDNVTNPPIGQIANTFYPIGLLNAMGADDYSAGSDVNTQFNANIGTTGCLQGSSGWYYGFSTPASGFIGFTTVLLHEITHGLGFASLTNGASGAKASGIDDIYSNFLYSMADNASWSVASGLSDGQRASSATSDNGLLWTGSNVNTQAIGVLTAGFQDNDTSSSFTAGDRVEMYAPNPFEQGSSVSHFNTAASPNELMEPQYTEGQYTLGLAVHLLKDIGWSVTLAGSGNNAPVLTSVSQSTNEDVALVVNASGWATDADGGDTLTYSVSSACATNITCSINTDGTNFTMTPAANHNGGTHTITLNVSDGNGGADSDTFNLNIIAQNDAPSWSAISNQNVNIGTAVNINLASFATDLENDTLTYTATACGSGLSCPISGSTLTLNAASNSGATVNVTIQANDGNSGLTSTSFNVSITSTNTAPVLSSISNQGAPVNTSLTVNLSANDAEGNALTYSVSNDPGNVASLSGSTLTLSKASTGTFSVTVRVSDGNLSDDQTFSFTSYAEPSIDINSTSLNPNDSLGITNAITSIDISSVNNNYSYALLFEGANANNLLSISGNNLSIAMPSSGQFAGEYVLTFTDGNTGATYDFTLERDPRLVFSASKLLANQTVQTFDIEGGAASTVYTLTSSESGLTFSKNSNEVTSITADGDAESFYKASLMLSTGSVNDSTDVTISASSVFNTVESANITLEPKRTHILNIEDNLGSALAGATVTLDISGLGAYNLNTLYNSDAQGQVSVVLPANTTDYSSVASLTGYANVAITLDDSLLSQTIIMEEITDPMSLSGTISALEGLSFATELPVLTLVLSDNSEVNIPLTLVNSKQANFNYVHDLNQGTVSALTVSHSNGVSATVNLNTRGNTEFNIFMSSRTQDTDNGTKETSSGGGVGIWGLLLLLVAVTRRFKVKLSH